MSYRMWLKDWVQPGYLQPDTVESCRRAFNSHPARMLVLKDFLPDQVAEKLSRFLSHEARFEPAYGLYSKNVRDGNLSGVSPSAWLESGEGEKFYRFSDYAGVLDEFQSSPNRTLFQQFFSALRGDGFRLFFEGVSGLELGPAPLINAYSYGPGDFLSLHTDDVKSKRLSFVFYLSPHWERRFGGLLHMIDHKGDVTEVDPDYNSLVIFDVSAKTEHYINPVERCAGGRARLTVSGWFLAP
ncbi:MAG TPA: 2OG-Fe(II) oxygenase family protein [Blastocatellia bacterium]|nr:2OG-Fe(II) oxygenase family protein [Blastocatellia bacterium]